MLVAGACLLAVIGCHKATTPRDAVTLAEMNQAVRFMSVGGGAPKSVDALTNFPAFKGRPLAVPPAGKQFIIDRSTGKIVVGDK